ncbi:MAG: GlsB/YeaQ/YmgE family stress response membrane protein [Betaproteobacteria bacterium]|nr:GlsB/YeaQ/YmgE family stress response membrane protein [Betaproteobacteria bacterium]MDH3435622.1 GlsB/YeaQ/YmgE family stress response membrane protein [Betaproteobacteria bacterium]
MNIAMWVLAGGLLGWIGFAILKANAEQGMVLSIVIGAVGGLFGGNVLAPMLGAVTETSTDFSLFSLVIALASAAGCLLIGNLYSDRFGV